MSFARGVAFACIAFIGGVAGASFIFSSSKLSLFSCLVVGCLGIAAIISVFYVFKRQAKVAFCIGAVFLLGGVYFFFYVGHFVHTGALSFVGVDASFKGVVYNDPKITQKSQQLPVLLEDGSRILVTTNSFPTYSYGDILNISGKVDLPGILESDTGNFNYQGYLLKDKIVAVMFSPEITVIGHEGSRIKEVLFSVRHRLNNTFSCLSAPEGAIASAMVTGDRSRISQEVQDAFSKTGTVHILSISGTHMAIFFELILFAFIAVGFWRKKATIASLAVLWAYSLLVGFCAPVVRSAFMASVVFSAPLVDRRADNWRPLVFAATAILLINPLLLWFDISFQLSFLAITGLVFVTPLIERVIKPKNFLLQCFSATIAAQILCFPILTTQFSQGLSVFAISPLTNAVILPILPCLLIAGVIFSVTSIMVPSIAFLPGFVVYLTCHYIILVVNFIGKLF